MPERESVTDADECDLAERWRVSLDTVLRVRGAAQDFGTETGGKRVFIISGWRSRAQQRALGRRGRPTAPDNRSTHRSCPATGIDISLGLLPSNFEIVRWGHWAFVNGLRWGGGGPVDPKSLIPKDWQHVDLGPRR